MRDNIAFFAGAADSFNIRQTVQSLGKMLSEAFTLDLISTNQLLTEEADSDYNVFGNNYSTTLRGDYRALDAYLCSTEVTCVMNITEPPIHGNIVGILAQKHSVPFIYRYSGDRFNVYNLANGLNMRTKWFLLNNVAGRIPLRLASKYIALGPVSQHPTSQCSRHQSSQVDSNVP
jgi:hypothetical protein